MQAAALAADDKLAADTVAFFVGDVLAITDWFLVTSGSNPRQVRAIVEQIEQDVDAAGGPKPIRIEGLDTSTWVLMDFGSFIAHVFTAEAREFYELERLWNDVERLDLGLPVPPAV